MSRGIMMTDAIPEKFNRAFLEWFRTQRTWRKSTKLEQHVKAGMGGPGWQQGTRWLEGLKEEEITAIRRLSSQVLHSVILRKIY